MTYLKLYNILAKAKEDNKPLRATIDRILVTFSEKGFAEIAAQASKTPNLLFQFHTPKSHVEL